MPSNVHARRSVTTVSLFNSLDTNMKSTWNDIVWWGVSVFVKLRIFYSFDRSSMCLSTWNFHNFHCEKEVKGWKNIRACWELVLIMIFVWSIGFWVCQSSLNIFISVHFLFFVFSSFISVVFNSIKAAHFGQIEMWRIVVWRRLSVCGSISTFIFIGTTLHSHFNFAKARAHIVTSLVCIAIHCIAVQKIDLVDMNVYDF